MAVALFRKQFFLAAVDVKIWLVIDRLRLKHAR
jgi:hypothetical protein